MAFLTPDEREERLAAGKTAIDLGAAPGGWTWQLVQRGMMVIAVDNGAMDPALLESGQVKHRRDDGFHYVPTEPVDWMVCDIVDKPSRVASLVATWIAEGHARRSIFNLKLPMKRRHEEVERCRTILVDTLSNAGVHAEFGLRHLYHDREEITGYVARV